MFQQRFLGPCQQFSLSASEGIIFPQTTKEIRNTWPSEFSLGSEEWDYTCQLLGTWCPLKSEFLRQGSEWGNRQAKEFKESPLFWPCKLLYGLLTIAKQNARTLLVLHKCASNSCECINFCLKYVILNHLFVLLCGWAHPIFPEIKAQHSYDDVQIMLYWLKCFL